jgi:AP-1 complex subunit mu
MVASAIYLMDGKGKVIISRNYRGDIPMTVSDRLALFFASVFLVFMFSAFFCRFSLHIQEKEETELRPVFTEDGITYIYIKVNTF